MVVIVINSFVIVFYFKVVDLRFVGIVVMVFFIVLIGYVVVWLIGKMMKRCQEEIVFFIFMGGMRNISVGVVFVVMFFLF